MVPLNAFALALCAPVLVWSSILQPRDQSISQCNLDNCYRQIRSNSVKASPFCTTYVNNPRPHVYPVTLTSYTTVVPTVFHVGTGTAKSDYVTRRVNPYTPYGQEAIGGPNFNKRAPAPTPPPALEVRQAAIPTFASSCGGVANRVSSACTCLIGDGPYTTTSTVAVGDGPPYRTVGVCGAPESGYDNHNMLIFQGGFERTYNKGVISFAEYPEINDIDVCCKKCYHTPECASFNLDPNKPGCQLNFVTGSNSPPGDHNCPLGVQEIYTPFDNFNNSFGVGLCGYLLNSDE